MSNGTWNPTQSEIRPGLYNRFIAAALSRVSSGPNGVVGIIITADWGPDNSLVNISDEKALLTTFGSGGTTYLVKRALLAGTKYKPNKAVVYRMATSSAAAAAISIAGTVKFEAKNKGKRGNDFKYSITINALDETKMDIKFYEGASLLATYTVAPADIAGLVQTINADTNSLIIAKKIGTTALVATALTNFTGGDSGTTVTVDDYLKALDAFEPVYVNALSSNITDPAVRTTLINWTKRVRTAGKDVLLVIGGSADEDKTPTTGNTRSVSANHEGVINVITGTIDGNGNSYSSAETACQIAGLVAACPINKSITYKSLEDVSDVTVLLTNDQIKAALQSGSFVLVRDFDPETQVTSVRIEQGINTLTTYSSTQGRIFSKIRAIKTMDAIDYDTGRYATKSVIGELDNNADGQTALLCAIKSYLETLVAANAISKDFLVEVDSSLVSDGDTVYLNTKALATDSIEKIFNTIHV